MPGLSSLLWWESIQIQWVTVVWDSGIWIGHYKNHFKSVRMSRKLHLHFCLNRGRKVVNFMTFQQIWGGFWSSAIQLSLSHTTLVYCNLTIFFNFFSILIYFTAIRYRTIFFTNRKPQRKLWTHTHPPLCILESPDMNSVI